MKKLSTLFAVIIALAACTYVMADEAREYTIQEHDTLWDISDSELADPFLWPKLWNVNPQIENPDLIYPGSTIKIPSREELMRMERPFKPRPVFRQQRRVEKVKPVEVMLKKDLKHYLVSRDLYISSGWIAAELNPLGRVHSSPMNRALAGKGDTVYLKVSYLSVKSPTPRNARFFTARDVKLVKHPVTGAKLGHQIRITGAVEIIGKESGLFKARVIESYEDIQMGEMLLPYTEMEPPLVPEAPGTPEVEGYIVESHTNNFLNGKGDIVFLDRGRNDGLQVGDILTVFADPPTRRPLARIQVFALQPSTSSAVVIDGTDEVTIGAVCGPAK
jgi:hypothetical protein